MVSGCEVEKRLQLKGSFYFSEVEGVEREDLIPSGPYWPSAIVVVGYLLRKIPSATLCRPLRKPQHVWILN